MQIGKRHNFGFTLIELIVVIIIIAIIAGFSAMSYSKIAKDMKISSATNTVVASLDNARALAIRNNRYVITVFRPRLLDDGTEQVVEIFIADWTGDSTNAMTYVFNSNKIWTYDRFVPIPNIKVRTLPKGIGIAGPAYSTGDDSLWWVPTYLPAVSVDPDGEAKGEMLGVLYSPEGRVVVRNAESAADRIWVDFDNDGYQTLDPDPDRDGNQDDAEVINWPDGNVVGLHYAQGFDLEPGGEPNVGVTLIIAVFDEAKCRSMYDPTRWFDQDWRYIEHTEFINQFADPIQFNRYSGVPLK